MFVSLVQSVASLPLRCTPFLPVKLAYSPALATHGCVTCHSRSCCSDICVLCFTPSPPPPRPRKAYYSIPAALRPPLLPQPFPVVLQSGYYANRMPRVCSMHNPGKTTYWDK